MPRARRPARRTAAAIAVVLAAGLVAAAPLRGAGGGTGGTTTITLLATNDFHNQLAPRRNPGGWDHGLGGAAWLAAHLANVRERAPDALHVDAGDMTGAGRSGFPIPLPLADEATVDVMGMMGLDVAVVGNHEFDRSTEHLQRVRGGGCWDDVCAYRHDAVWAGAPFETLSANVAIDHDEPLFRGWTIREVDGVQVGFVGITETSTIRQDDLLMHHPYAAVNLVVDQVVDAGADVVVVLSHVGAKQNPLLSYDVNGCQNLTGPTARFLSSIHDAVDVVVDAHTHHAYVCDRDGEPLLTQASHRGVMFTEITLEFHRQADRVVERTAVNRLVTHDVAPDPRVARRVAHYADLSRGRDAPGHADLDGDGRGDAFEFFWGWTDPLVAD